MRQHFFSKHDNRTSFDKVSAGGPGLGEREREVGERRGLPRAGTQRALVSLPADDRGHCLSGPPSEWRQGFRPARPGRLSLRGGTPGNAWCQDCGPRARTVEKGPYCLLQGIGKRKDLARLCQRPTFLQWASNELELCQQRPLESSYQSNFPGPSDLPQRLVHFVQVQSPRTYTTYQQNFCQPCPSGDSGGPQVPNPSTPTNLPKIPMPKPLQHYLHEGVSECLNWTRALNKDG